MRCLAIIKNRKVTLKSRDGKIIENMDHIINDLKPLDDCILDGELYAHGLTFQENMKLIKKYRPGETELIKYHIYDTIIDFSFIIRYNKLSFLFDNNVFNHLIKVRTILVTKEESIKLYHDIFLCEGYEGSIIRHGSKSYEINKRSDSLLKFKYFQDMDLPIIDITPNEVNPKHGTPHFSLNGKTFKAGCKLSHEDREDLLNLKHYYKGKIANIRYFELTDDGIPRFPVMIGIHEDR
jgi:DNA ligase-1